MPCGTESKRNEAWWIKEAEKVRFSSHHLRVQATKGGSAFMGGVDPSKHHEGCSHYAILLF